MSRHWAIALVLAAAAPLYLLFTHNDGITSSFGDSVIYLLTARHYASPLAPLLGDIAAQSQYPPLYPLLLVLAGGGQDIAAAHVATTLVLLLAFAALYFWQLRMGAPRTTAAAFVLIVAMIPGVYLNALLVMSEPLFLAFSVAALMFLEPQPQKLPTLAAATLFVSAAAMTRSVGVILFLPLALAAWRSPRRAMAFAVVVIGLLPIAAWSHMHRPAVSYTDALKAIYGADPVGIFSARLPSQVFGIFHGMAEELGGRSNPTPLAGIAVGVLLLAAVVRAAQMRVDGVYVAAYFCILLIWPYPSQLARLSFVILPITIVQLAAVMRSLPWSGSMRRWLPAGGFAVALVFLVPMLLGTSQRFRAAADARLPSASGNPLWYDPDNVPALRVKIDDATVESFKRISDFVPADDCVYTLLPAFVTFYSGRRGVVPPLDEPDDDRFTRTLVDMGCSYILLRDTDSPAGIRRMFPSSRIRVGLQGIDAGTFEVPGRAEPVVVSILAKLEK